MYKKMREIMVRNIQVIVSVTAIFLHLRRNILIFDMVIIMGFFPSQLVKIFLAVSELT